ncbi:MAG: glycosyltransferase family 39 protein [Planctomycetota bacterium]|jgi:hypothetical protein
MRGGSYLRIMLAVSAVVTIFAAVLLRRTCKPITPPPRLPLTGLQLRLVFGLGVGALLLRGTRISESLWYDELSVLRGFLVYEDAGLVVGNLFAIENHIFQSLLSTLCMKLSNGVMLPMRLPALLFSFASIWAVYRLARTTLDRRPALIAAMFMAIAPVAVLPGVEARGYSLMIFFSAMTSWLLLDGLKYNRPSTWFAYAICCALGGWSHLFTLFVPVGHGLYLVIRLIRERSWAAVCPALTALLLGAVLTITLYAPVMEQLLEVMRKRVTNEDAAGPSLFGTEGLHGVMSIGGGWYIWSSVAGLVFAVIGMATMAGDSALRRLAVVTLLGGVIVDITFAVTGTWVYARFGLFLLPAAAVMIAIGVDVAWRRHATAGMLAIALLGACWAGDLYVRPAKQPLRDAAEYVIANGSATDDVLVLGLGNRVFDFYMLDRPPRYSNPHGADLAQHLQQGTPDWLVVYYPKNVASDRFDMIDAAGFDVVENFRGWVDWDNGDVLIYRSFRP